MAPPSPALLFSIPVLHPLRTASTLFPIAKFLLLCRYAKPSVARLAQTGLAWPDLARHGLLACLGLDRPSVNSFYSRKLRIGNPPCTHMTSSADAMTPRYAPAISVFGPSPLSGPILL